ncbi:MAG: exodeoxyribonuclease VII large subunit [Lentisphaeria bacterium]|nr:exodeoxyribonuclease VII large subunit [Lentisphaeria bacterium]
MDVDKPNTIWTITQLNQKIRTIIDHGLPPLWLKGEITDLNIHRSGHLYLSLKDAGSKISAVMFNGANKASELSLKNGMQVEVFGKIRVYDKQGQYQIYIEKIMPGGMGELQQKFEELKAQLQKEGLFDPTRKKPIPAFPKCIGLVTSLNGAALKDFLHVVERRFPDVHIRVIDCRMQGEEASLQAIRSIRYLNRSQACDVIVLTRGGGSMEDLWCFNNEELVRQIAASEIPVISAIGHEIDFTLCDFVADLRAATPSAAAEIVTGSQMEFKQQLQQNKVRLEQVIRYTIDQKNARLKQTMQHLDHQMEQQFQIAKQKLTQLSEHFIFKNPQHLLENRYHQLSDAQKNLQHSMEQNLQEQKEKLLKAKQNLFIKAPERQLAEQEKILLEKKQKLHVCIDQIINEKNYQFKKSKQQLQDLNPRSVLARGYAIMRAEKSGDTIKTAKDLQEGQSINLMMKDADLSVTIDKIKPLDDQV